MAAAMNAQCAERCETEQHDRPALGQIPGISIRIRDLKKGKEKLKCEIKSKKNDVEDIPCKLESDMSSYLHNSRQKYVE